nr:MAG TPA: hypothetical protein [Bacteriophage sp.]
MRKLTPIINNLYLIVIILYYLYYIIKLSTIYYLNI